MLKQVKCLGEWVMTHVQKSTSMYTISLLASQQ